MEPEKKMLPGGRNCSNKDRDQLQSVTNDKGSWREPT